MSTLQSKQEAKRTNAGEIAPGFGHPGLLAPYDLAAVSAAHAHGVFVWTVVLAGLSGFRPELLPVATISWGVASASWAGLATCLSMTSALTSLQAPPTRSA